MSALARPQAREADRGVRARRCKHAHVGGQALDRVVDRSKRSLAPDGVDVLEDNRRRTAVRDQTVHQLVDGRADGRTPDAQAQQRPPSKALTEPLDGCRQVRPQPRWVLVRRIERDPDDGLPALDAPRAQERGLAVAERAVDQRERSAAVEQLQ